ncbi:uncharacterized protein EKO05_0007740 [Ascochyta rabiei]|uniref:Uncharacterized protein n=1 Tax=Didymella rabiei TaxID=5454 RepID=A0A163CCL3_DIDRA|nr:uncharacterized protein EKO05_0007740 [Ascochyta rabiei]KZM22365.1 hypothetical protein ST47_g6497 [Ascochyta rabiei]UPX17380.1 hypothetical protein EKO05_0007740 [Ascochyta rabiei]
MSQLLHPRDPIDVLYSTSAAPHSLIPHADPTIPTPEALIALPQLSLQAVNPTGPTRNQALSPTSMVPQQGRDKPRSTRRYKLASKELASSAKIPTLSMTGPNSIRGQQCVVM